MTSRLPVLLRAASLALVLVASASAVHAGKAHQHGVARLDISVEPGRITLDLDSPLDNLLGFERAPRTDAERAKADAAIKRLKDAASLFRVDGAAGCTLDKVELESAALQLGKSAAAPGATGKGEHADLDGHFEFKCQAGAKAGFVEVLMFDAFPSLRRIDLQIATPRGQVKATLNRPASRVNLVR